MNRLEAWKAGLVSMLILGVFCVLPGCGKGVFGGGSWDKPVTVSSTTPENGGVNAPTGSKLTAIFSGAMDPATLTTGTFTLQQGGAAVPGTVSYVGVTAVFTPAGNLAASTLYSASITTGARDLSGHALARDYVWSFTTGVSPDTVAPTVSVTSPTNADLAVPVNRQVKIGFSEAMDPETITGASFSVKETLSGNKVTGTVTSVGTSATFAPAGNLANSTGYTVTVGTGGKDLAGNAMASDFVFGFSTGAVADTVAPTVSVTSPTSTAVAVPVNRKVNVGFSEAMDPLTITAASFTLKETASGASVPGTVTSVATSATFTPTNNLANSTKYSATIAAGVKDLAGNAQGSDFVFTFTTGAAADLTAPTVSFTSPANGAIAVPQNRIINAAFSEAMDPLSLNAQTFKVTGPGQAPVAGTVGAVGPDATFIPLAGLAASTLYTATISVGAKDLAGNALAANYQWSFTTGAALDTTAPTVLSTIPVDLATGVAINSVVSATFSEAVDPLTVSTASFALRETASGNNVSGTVGYAVGSRTATFTPLANLSSGLNYSATIKGGAGGVKDLAGNPLALDKVWSFTTGAALDTVAPTVILVNPADLASAVAINSSVHATFSKAMAPLTISTGSFTLRASGPPQGPVLPGTVSYDPLSNIATLTPGSNLAPNTSYTATVSTAAADLAGNTLASSKVWSFTTAAPGAGLAPGAAPLGAAGSFGIMATSAITNTGFSVINGDVSLDPGTSLTGFPPAVVNGTIHINDTASAQARIDLLTAYNFAKNLPPGTTISAGADLGALYPLGVPPGTYTSGSTMLIGTPLVLDAGGNANAVWVFQVGSSLTTGASVTLVNGAQAKNVFWVPTLDATIGVGTIFYGTIVSGRNVTGVTGATINGRILAGATTAGTIALDSNTVNVPAP